MKISGGYTPKIAGRPLGIVEELPLPRRLILGLNRQGLEYSAIVADGQKVEFGEPLAEISTKGGKLFLPATAAGTVRMAGGKDHRHLVLEEVKQETASVGNGGYQPQRITGEKMRRVLAESGIWPFFWSSVTGGIPSLETDERPKSIIVNFVFTEPFRARGKIILGRSWSRIMAGIRFLPRIMDDYGKIEIVLTAVRDPVAKMMYSDLSGFAWVRFHPVPVTYPVENPRLLNRMLRKSISAIRRQDPVWVIDAQGMEGLGACLAEGLPLHHRLLAVGGPGRLKPSHLAVRIGTPLSSLSQGEKDIRILRGGRRFFLPSGDDFPAILEFFTTRL